MMMMMVMMMMMMMKKMKVVMIMGLMGLGTFVAAVCEVHSQPQVLERDSSASDNLLHLPAMRYHESWLIGWQLPQQVSMSASLNFVPSGLE